MQKKVGWTLIYPCMNASTRTNKLYSIFENFCTFLHFNYGFSTLVVWIIPLQRSQSRWGRRRVGWQARRKIWGHWGFVLSYFWQIIKLEGALCVVLFLSGNQDAILSSILLNFSILLYLYQPQAALFHTNKSIIV